MSDQDRPFGRWRAAEPVHVAANLNGAQPPDAVIRQPQEATVVVPSASVLRSRAARCRRRREPGRRDRSGQPARRNEARAIPAAVPSSTLAGGSSHRARPRSRRRRPTHCTPSRAASAAPITVGAEQSAWDTFDGGSTGVHATSAAPHAGVRIQPVRDDQEDRRGRDGERVPRPRSPARPPGRDQVPAVGPARADPAVREARTTAAASTTTSS